MLSAFEAALLERHLRRCGSCRAFAAGAEAHTRLLRAAELEQPARHVVLPSRRPVVRRGVAGALTAVVAAGAAAVMILAPGTNDGPTGGGGVRSAARGVAPMVGVVSARPTPTARVDVPRLEVQPKDLADGPVHGLYSIPV